MLGERTTLFILTSVMLFINQCGSAPQTNLLPSTHSPIVQPLSLISTPPGPAADFAFRFTYGACYANIVDTFAGTYTKDMIVASPITIALTLSAEEKTRIYTKMHNINIFGYPAIYRIDTTHVKEVTQVIPAMGYKFTIQNAGNLHDVQWADDIVKPTAPDADRLRELAQLIIDIVEQRPEVQQLPIPGAACL